MHCDKVRRNLNTVCTEWLVGAGDKNCVLWLQITFNGGAQWSQLLRPVRYRHAECDRCKAGDADCKLHLHGPTGWVEGPGDCPHTAALQCFECTALHYCLSLGCLSMLPFIVAFRCCSLLLPSALYYCWRHYQRQFLLNLHLASDK